MALISSEFQFEFVDDILWGGNAEFSNLIDNLKEIFPIGLKKLKITRINKP